MKWLLCITLALAACTNSEVGEPSVERTSALQVTFEEAARTYQVPVRVLEAVGYVETRLSLTSDLQSASGGVGLMQLARRGGVDAIGEATRLTGATEGQLTVDPHASIRGAAAVLRARFDQVALTRPELDSRQVGDWFLAVSRYPGFEGVTESMNYASDVFLLIERGFEAKVQDGVLRAAPMASTWRRYAPQSEARRDALAEYPAAAAWVASPNFSAGRSSYEFIVIHTMQGTYSGTISWFQNRSASVSAHYVVRSSDGQITQMVEHGDTAWHVQCYNSRSIGIEHEGYVQDPATWYTDAMYEESAKLASWIADRHSLAKTRTTIIGHGEVPSNCNTNGHTDPGSGWNWTKYMGFVTGGGPGPGTGVLLGAIYTGGDSSNRVAGATVTVGSQTVTSGSDGMYQLTLAPGTYTATVSKTGYASASVMRTVAAGTQTWGSVEINPSVATGTLRGTIYAVNAANPNDTSNVLSGATVTTNGQSVTTGSNGAYQFTLAAGAYTVAVAKSGYAGRQVQATVNSGATTTTPIGLTATTSADTQPPTVSITFPAANASLDLGKFDVKGSVVDDRGVVSQVSFAINAAPPVNVSAPGGVFSVEALLKPGMNELVVSAQDAAGNVGRATVRVTFNAGVGGVVFPLAMPSGRVAGAVVELRQPSTGVVLATSTSDANGTWFTPAANVPGDYLLMVRKDGYVSSSQTVTIPREAKLIVDVGLVEGNDVPVETTLRFIEPLNGATVQTDSVNVYGAVSGFEVASVVVNGVNATLLGAGGFSVTVPVEAKGENVIEAVATSTSGQTVSGRVSVIRPKPEEAGGGCGGCSAVDGGWLLGVIGAAWLLRKRGLRASLVRA